MRSGRVVVAFGIVAWIAAAPRAQAGVEGSTLGGVNHYENYGPNTFTGPDEAYALTMGPMQQLDAALTPLSIDYDAALVIVRDLQDVAGTIVAISDVGGGGDIEQLAYATVENPETLYLIVDGYSGSAGPYTLDAGAFTLTPVPEPGSGVFAAVFALAILRARRGASGERRAR